MLIRRTLNDIRNRDELLTDIVRAHAGAVDPGFLEMHDNARLGTEVCP